MDAFQSAWREKMENGNYDAFGTFKMTTRLVQSQEDKLKTIGVDTGLQMSYMCFSVCSCPLHFCNNRSQPQMHMLSSMSTDGRPYELREEQYRFGVGHIGDRKGKFSWPQRTNEDE